MIHGLRLTRVVALTQRRIGNVILVLAILAIQQLRRDGHRRNALQQGHLQRHQREVPFGEADLAGGTHLQSFSGRGTPQQCALQGSRTEVQAPRVLLAIGLAHQQRFVVDVQLDQLGVRHVHQRLAHLGKPEHVLGVLD